MRAHEMAIEYCKIRQTFGATLSSRQGIQWMLVENEVDLRTMRLLVLDAAARADRGEPVPYRMGDRQASVLPSSQAR